jgi:3-hydroxybutyryl-CoA dehydrogenase
MQIGVIGSGNMGRGIAQVSATAGHTVVLQDIDEGQLSAALDDIASTMAGGVERGKLTAVERDAALDRIQGTTDLEEAVESADLVIEAVPENLDLKQQVFEDLDAAAPEDAVLASNTSSLSLTEVASVLERPERAVGLHFFNPPHIMDLVEIIVAEQTDAETESTATAFVEDLDKEAVVVRDTAGFASSRLGIALGLEAIRMVEEGVASASDIDAAMRTGYGHPMGPLELTDHVGLDVRLDIAEYLREELGERFRPPQLLRRKVRAGNYGKKSGEGFYVWEDRELVGEADTGGR